MYLTQGLHRAVQQTPELIATRQGDRVRTYAEHADRVARLAAGLHSLGVRTGDRVAMLSLNSDRYIEYYLGVYWAGAVATPVNTRWSPAEVAFSLDDSDATVLLVDRRFAPMVAELRERSKALKTIVFADEGETPEGMLSYEDLLAANAPVEDAYRNGNDLAAIFYTGGTTGVPKGVMLSHSNMYITALAGIAERGWEQNAVTLHVAPMFHLADAALINTVILRGATHAVVPSFTPQQVLESIERDRVTDVLLVPTMLQMLVDSPDFARYDTSSLRKVVYGASPTGESLISRAMQAFPQAEFSQGYGMTETSPTITVLRPFHHLPENRGPKTLRAAGQPALTVQVRIVDEDGNEAPRGQVGEITVRGPGVMLGYWNRPEETAEAIRNGWMHTGDAGYMDENGMLYIVDRIKDMIVSGGENVYSAEVENALVSHPKVAMCAVIGVPDERWGERVHAVVVVQPGQTVEADELIAHCRARIAGYKCPRSVEFRTELPISGAGKLLKNPLRAEYWKNGDRRVAGAA